MQSQSQLIDFMTDMSLDPDLLMSFLADPAAAMKAAKLPEEDVQALASGNRHAVFSRVAGVPFDENDPVAAFIPAYSTHSTIFIAFE